MKKGALLLAIALVALVAFQGALLAGTVEGTVKSVDVVGKKLEVTTATGTSSVAYTGTTTWPADVTDPSTLAGKTVKISTDDTTSEATSVATA